VLEVDRDVNGVPGTRLRIATAPLPDEAGARLTWALEGAFGADEKPDIYVTPTAKGMDAAVSHNEFAWIEAGDRAVSASWLGRPADEPRIGTLGEVYTDPAWRRRGFAHRTCAALVERFDAGGGRWLFLATDTADAARIYASLGFEPYPEGLMRRVRPVGRAFEDEWFAPSAVVVRPIHRGDLVRLVALYSAPNPWLSIAWMDGIYSASHVTHNRCNSLIKHTWLATRAGAWLGLTNAEGAIVGAAPLEPSGNERDPVEARLDLFVHPAFTGSASTLLAAALAEARRRSWRWLLVHIADGDEEKAALLEGVGFRSVVTLSTAVRIGGRERAVRLLRLAL
jgi:GNAT superfamily N-acetyltransferase